jgi:lipopolysaccharide transport system ATP-binding protein
MAPDAVIRVEQLGKRYRLGIRRRHDTLRDALTDAMVSPFRRVRSRLAAGGRPEGDRDDTIWVLQDVSFEVKAGEVVGIVGRNGAGKSTLLKILCRVTEPTTGYAELHGRVGSLLEVGTGFHPELSGRENIFLNGAILGMRKGEIDRRFDEIVAFAEVERFIDVPVKRYSSGMYVRLAFAVAAHLEPEILLVDEVLAVGDSAFQQKCLGKIGEVTRGGRTVLFVSHNMSAVNRLCPKAMWLDSGRLIVLDTSEQVIARYLAAGRPDAAQRHWKDHPDAPGNAHFRLSGVRVLTSKDEVSSSVDVRLPFYVEIEYRLRTPIPSLRVGFQLIAADGTVVFASGDTSHPAGDQQTRRPGRYVSRCQVPGELLAPGQYTITGTAEVPFVEVLAVADAAVTFHVDDTGGAPGHYPERSPGVIRPSLPWEVRHEPE